MNTKEYIDSVKRSESPDFYDLNKRLLHGAMGCCTESGELLDALKKACFYGRSLDLTNVKEEIGDILWYVAIIIDELGTTFEDIMEINIEKLKARYPGQFTEEAAYDRNLKIEHEVMVKLPKPCFQCNGTGSMGVDSGGIIRCWYCGGTGDVIQ